MMVADRYKITQLDLNLIKLLSTISKTNIDMIFYKGVATCMSMDRHGSARLGKPIAS